MRDWNSQARNREARLARAAHLARGKIGDVAEARTLLDRVREPGDRVCQRWRSVSESSAVT
jgi:malonate decarboxylase alpha subunit